MNNPSTDLESKTDPETKLFKTIIKVNCKNEVEKGYVKLRSMSSVSSSSSSCCEAPPITIASPSFRTRSVSTPSSLDSAFQSESSSLTISTRQVENETKEIKLTEAQIKLLEEVFSENLEENQTSLSITEFQNMFQFKSHFFLERVFSIFDKHGNGSVTLENFIGAVEKYALFDDDAKIEFFIDLYDTEGSGSITLSELKNIVAGCVKESGMALKEPHIAALTSTLFQDCTRNTGSSVITKVDLRRQLKKHKELLSSMSILMDTWLMPKKVPKKMPLRYLSKDYWRNNKSFLSFLFLILVANLVIFIHRAFYFRHFPMLSGFVPNPFYV